MMTTLNSSAPRFAERYARDSVGGLLGAALEPAGGFGQFCLVVLAFGIVANNIPNMYSLALTTQALHPWLQAIPRPFICIIGTVVYVVLAIVGVDHFESWLDTLLVLLSYWLAIYSTILLEEHLIFRRGNWANYDPDRIADWKSLPVGIAASVALVAGGELNVPPCYQGPNRLVPFSSRICVGNVSGVVYRCVGEEDRTKVRRRYWV